MVPHTFVTLGQFAQHEDVDSVQISERDNHYVVIGHSVDHMYILCTNLRKDEPRYFVSLDAAWSCSRTIFPDLYPGLISDRVKS